LQSLCQYTHIPGGCMFPALAPQPAPAPATPRGSPKLTQHTSPHTLRTQALITHVLHLALLSCTCVLQQQEDLLKPLPPSKLLTWTEDASREPQLGYAAAGCLAALAHHPKWLAELTVTPTATHRVSSRRSSSSRLSEASVGIPKLGCFDRTAVRPGATS
jgi:hypothetical protein